MLPQTPPDIRLRHLSWAGCSQGNGKEDEFADELLMYVTTHKGNAASAQPSTTSHAMG
jgi:hypothetical protein